MAQLYDPFTISPLMQLEAYGFVKEGHGGPFYADGGAGPDGPIPTNTGGGQLSAYYTTGFTGIIEAALQLRGASWRRPAQARRYGTRQRPRHECRRAEHLGARNFDPGKQSMSATQADRRRSRSFATSAAIRWICRSGTRAAKVAFCCIAATSANAVTGLPAAASSMARKRCNG